MLPSPEDGIAGRGRDFRLSAGIAWPRPPQRHTRPGGAWAGWARLWGYRGWGRPHGAGLIGPASWGLTPTGIARSVYRPRWGRAHPSVRPVGLMGGRPAWGRPHGPSIRATSPYGKSSDLMPPGLTTHNKGLAVS